MGIIDLKNIALNTIDGSCLELINENELDEDLQIKQNIIKKKLFNCKS